MDEVIAIYTAAKKCLAEYRSSNKEYENTTYISYCDLILAELIDRKIHCQIDILNMYYTRARQCNTYNLNYIVHCNSGLDKLSAMITENINLFTEYIKSVESYKKHDRLIASIME
jgi:hypothetical protein